MYRYTYHLTKLSVCKHVICLSGSVSEETKDLMWGMNGKQAHSLSVDPYDSEKNASRFSLKGIHSVRYSNKEEYQNQIAKLVSKYLGSGQHIMVVDGQLKPAKS